MSLTVSIRSCGYPRKTVLHDLDFTVEGGTLTAIVGRNGEGKSTLLSAIAALLPFDGSITLDGVSLAALPRKERAARVAYMLQEPRLPDTTVEAVVGYGRYPHLSLGKVENGADRSAVEAALQKACLTELRHRKVNTLSGGERRRVALAMALATDAPVLLLDEPTAFLDADRENELLALAAALAREGKTVLAVLHDLNAAVSYADNILAVSGGGVAFFGSADAFAKSSLPSDVFSLRTYRASADGEERIFFAT